jgi:hypothetical protein
MIKGRTICFLADSLIMPVQSYIAKFRPEFEYHIQNKKCQTNTEAGKFVAPQHLALQTA